jgi:hypothetical protein
LKPGVIDITPLQGKIQKLPINFDTPSPAQDFGIDIVVTRDKIGFHNSGLQVYSPEEFLNRLE